MENLPLSKELSSMPMYFWITIVIEKEVDNMVLLQREERER